MKNRGHAATLSGLATLVIVCRCIAQDARSTIVDGQIDLVRLVDLAAERLNLNIEYDASQLRGSVTFRLGEPLGDDELWTLTNRLLASKGLTTIRRAGEDTVGVVPLSDAPGLARLEFGPRRETGPASGYRAVVVAIEHADPGEAAAVLQAFAGPRSGSIARVADSDLLILADLTPRVEQMLDVLAGLDTPEAAVATEPVLLASLSSEAAIARLGELIARRRAAGAAVPQGDVLAGTGYGEILVVAPRRDMPAWRSLIGTLDRASARETKTYRPSFFAIGEVRRLIDELLAADRAADATEGHAWRIIENTLIGTLIVTATPEHHARIEAFLQELAQAPAMSRRATRSFELQNRDAGEVRRVLQDLLTQRMLDIQPNPEGDQAAFGDARLSSGEPHEPRGGGARSEADAGLRLAVDEGTNTIIAAGEPRLLDQVGELIASLDVRRPQVMLEVLLVSLTEGQTLDLGVELQQLVSDSGTLFALGSLFGLSDLSPFVGGGGNGGQITELPGPGGSAVILDPGDFSAVVRALETVNEGRALSMPKVLVNDNEAATINSVVQEPFVSTNASDTVATTSFGGFESAGTTVAVTPQIAEGDHLLLQYSITLSSFTGESPDPAAPPPRQQNSISSVATIPDGFTIAVGGIELRNNGEAENRIPVLGTIPVLGELFKTRSRSESRSRFYAFIRADVLRHESFADLKHVSGGLREGVDLPPDEPVLLPRIIR